MSAGEEGGEDELSDIDGSQEEDEGDKENNSLISIYYQSEHPGNFEELNTIELIESLLEDEFFDSLRTKDQLGYYVSCSQRNTRGLPGLLFTIESSKYTLDVVEPKIYKFIKDFFEEKLNEKLYSDYLKGLINRKTEPFKEITEDSRFLMGALKDYYQDSERPFHWHRRSDAVKFLQENMTFERVK
jgi:secreted Zn-dependent insulinase-like peptidase